MWIEIQEGPIKECGVNGRGPRGPCGLKFASYIKSTERDSVEAREGLVD